jgi:hippurate hydrolase
MRAYSTVTLARMRGTVERIARATCAGAGAGDPRITVVAQSPANRPDPEVAGRVRSAHADAFGAARVSGWPPSLAADDFPAFAADGVPTAYWMLGTIGPAQWRSVDGDAEARIRQIPGNHSPGFAPHAALAVPTGIDALTAAAGVWLCER